MKMPTAVLLAIFANIATAESIDIVKGTGTGEEFHRTLENTCTADLYEKALEESKPQSLNPENDPYSLKKIHFTLVVMDTDGNGRITQEELQAYNPNEVGFWNKFDMNRDGEITGREVRNYIEQSLIAKWRNAFRSLDRDRSGYISARDLHRVYVSNLDQIDIEDTINRYDQDGDRQISITEYIDENRAKVAKSDLSS